MPNGDEEEEMMMMTRHHLGAIAARSTRAYIRVYSYSRRCERCPSIQFLGKEGWSAKRMPVVPPLSSDIMTIARVINSIRSSRLLFSSSSENEAMFAKSEYVHPLSQIVLERLQSHHATWVKRMGLTTGLKLNKDGTFTLRFPGGKGQPPDSGGVAVTPGEDDVDSIWTMYESEESKHYLCVKKGSLVGRYMLQDNKKQAWHSDRRSTPERVQDAVDEMISKFDEVAWKKV
jgi:hypothetical protein